MSVTIYLNPRLTTVTARAPQVIVAIVQQLVSPTDIVLVATTVSDHRHVLTILTALVESKSVTAVFESPSPCVVRAIAVAKVGKPLHVCDKTEG